ncbi:Ig-like domain-containing protein [Clostridium felsineum]|uniref:Ig-like domain-containing protein n=1 Tax=Clostridium felsineum TaxID=36839 RepID=UPI0009D0FD10|nr:Ig-like domain-containing protein [Clostridium felsineum]URZ00520.1 hypothetical protein CLAUR_005080 [Clostridium felsineum]
MRNKFKVFCVVFLIAVIGCFTSVFAASNQCVKIKKNMQNNSNIRNFIRESDNQIDQYSKLLMHMDNNNFKDEYGHTVVNNNVIVNNITKKFGTGSASFNGKNYFTVADSNNDFNLGNDDFTIDFWVYPTSFNGTNSLFSQRKNTATYSGMCIYINSNGELEINATSNGTSWDIAQLSVLASNIQLNKWNHIAVCRQGNYIYGFVNGIKGSKSIQIHSAIFSDESNVSIGEEENGITSLNGYLDEYRISKGIARWTNDFIPPSYPYDTATSISLDKTSLDVNVGETNTLNALIVPNDITNKAVIWVSSDPSIATVDKDGKVTAIKKGTAIITATTQDGSNLSASCTVNVKDSTTISLNKSTDSINIGGIDNLVATVNSSDVGVTWTSSDNSIVTVDKDGKITGVKAGQATITATTADGKTVACVVTVNSSDKAVLSITMTNGQTKQYNVNMDIVDNFLSWYNLRAAGSGNSVFKFDVTESSNPDIISTEYVVFNQICTFRVDDYKNK